MQSIIGTHASQNPISCLHILTFNYAVVGTKDKWDETNIIPRTNQNKSIN